MRHQTKSPRRTAEGFRILDVEEVTALVGVSRATLSRWQRDGVFPARRQLGRGRVGWLERDVCQWIETRPPAPGTAEARAQPRSAA